jgi:hypothetical protein
MKSKYFDMKKLLIVLIPLLFTGCDKNYDNIIDELRVPLQVVSLSSFDFFEYTPEDSVIELFVRFEKPENISSVFFDVLSPDQKKINTSSAFLFDDGDISLHGDSLKGDGIFSAKYPFSQSLSNGRYQISYYVEDILSRVRFVSTQSFTYENGKEKFPPVLSNLVIPDSATRGVLFVFSVKVDDPNGLADIEKVYFDLFRPDGTRVESGPFNMVDNGNNEIFGDLVAGDGIYSYKNSFGATAQTGLWRFEFEAKDLGKKLSNKIIHNIIVK